MIISNDTVYISKLYHPLAPLQLFERIYMPNSVCLRITWWTTDGFISCGVGVCVFQITTTTKKYSMILHAIYGHMVAGVSCDSFAILISFNFNIKLIIAIAFCFCSVKYIFFMRFTIATYLFCFSGFFFRFFFSFKLVSIFLTINGSFVVCFVFLCLFLIQPLFYSKYIPFFFSSHLCPNKSWKWCRTPHSLHY